MSCALAKERCALATTRLLAMVEQTVTRWESRTSTDAKQRREALCEVRAALQQLLDRCQSVSDADWREDAIQLFQRFDAQCAAQVSVMSTLR